MPTLADMYDGFLFELEGLLDREYGLIPFTGETVRHLYPIALFTGDATVTPVTVATLLAGMDVHVHQAQVVTLSQAAARQVTGLVPSRSDEFVLGAEPPNRAEDGPSYPPVIREAVRRTSARYPLVISQSMACVTAARLLHLPSVLVLNAGSDLRELLLAPPNQRPTYLATDLRDLFRSQPIVDCEARYWECEGWIATVSGGSLRLYPGPSSALAAGARVLCAAAWNWKGSDLDIGPALEMFASFTSAR